MKYLIILAFLIVGLSLYFFSKNKVKSTTVMVPLPASIGQNRVSSLGLPTGSTKDLGILDKNRIRFPVKSDEEEKADYRGIPEIHWIIDIVPPKGYLFEKETFLSVFDYDWRKNYESEFYAHFPSTKRWSFAISGDSPLEFDKLELTVHLAERFDEKQFSVRRLQEYLTELELRLKTFGVKFDIRPRETPEQAVAKSTKLKNFKRDLYDEVVVVLKSDSKFKSKEFWNTLIELGLKWGDGDLFHWENYDGDVGDQQLFSVWTSSNPGYFYPEDVASNQFQPRDLIFGFSIPRSADPERVFDAMVKSIEYCQNKLGGVILDDAGKEFSRELYDSRIEKSVDNIKENGFEFGRGYTMRIF